MKKRSKRGSIFIVTDKDAKIIYDMFINPPKPNEKLKATVKRYKEWKKGFKT